MAQHDLSGAGRRQLASKGIARPDGSYPIADQEDLNKAVKDWIRTGRNGAVRHWILKRARALNLELPEDMEPKNAPDEVETAKQMTSGK